MVVGGLMGRLIGHCIQWLVMTYNTWPVWDRCSRIGDATCIQPGVYALIAAGSTMCGVTRLSVTLAGKLKTSHFCSLSYHFLWGGGGRSFYQTDTQSYVVEY
jgi:hypothetical protein